MTAKFWTLLTSVDTVHPFYEQAEAESAAAAFVQSCDDSRIVTVENWRDELAALNKEMDDAGEATYLCALTEHLILPRRGLTILEYFVRNRGRSVSKGQVFNAVHDNQETGRPSRPVVDGQESP
jgi:DNA-binding response OmpR family regulator